MTGYYSSKLAAEKLRRCYDIAPPRIKQYLRAEIDFVITHIHQGDAVLDLGCGYGRTLIPLAGNTAQVVGVDNSFSSLLAGQKSISHHNNIDLAMMDAGRLAFVNNAFDATTCIQNGISAFNIDRLTLMREAIRVTKPGGTVLFSSYSVNIWAERLAWFELQAQARLLGEIDYSATGDGVIVCKDGFRAETVTPEEFESLSKQSGLTPEIIDVDCSSLFCIWSVVS